MPSEYYIRMSIPELVDALGSHAEAGSMRNEEIKGALQVKILEEQGRKADELAGPAGRRANIALVLSGISAVAAIAAVVVAVVSA